MPEKGRYPEPLAPARPGARWLPNPCTLCGPAEARFLFHVPVPDAPAGRCTIVACDVCGLGRLDPRPSGEALSELYPDDYYSYLGRRRSRRKQQVWDWLRDTSSGAVDSPRPVRALAAATARWRFDVNIPLRAPGRPRVLDVGCGYGDLLLYLRDRGCEVVGIELDERAAAAAGKLGLTVHARPLEAVGLATASIDVAIFQHSLEHLPDPAGTLGETARVTRPGGEIHIAVPNGGSAGFEHDREYWGAIFCPEHFWYFDVRTLTELLARNGFVVTHATTKAIWINHWRLIRWLLSRSRDGPAPIERIRLLRRAVRAFAGAGRPSRGDILRVVARRVPDESELR